MKIFLTLCSLLSIFCTSAQKITTADINAQDLQGVVSNLFRIEMCKYDLSAYLNKRCNFTLYIDEYTRTATEGLKKERLHTINTGQNRRFIDDIEAREYYKGEANFDEESNELTMIESLTIAARIENDSTALLSLNSAPMGMGGSFPMKVITLEDSYKKQPTYGSRPFNLEGSANEGGEIPLLLYGSFYYDEKAKLLRFCGEKEIDPNLSSQIVENIPHFYVVGIIIKEVKGN
ncbi:MAG: DUF5041 domain-containing protein [Rikenellaceae bacterium]